MNELLAMSKRELKRLELMQRIEEKSVKQREVAEVAKGLPVPSYVSARDRLFTFAQDKLLHPPILKRTAPEEALFAFKVFVLGLGSGIRS